MTANSDKCTLRSITDYMTTYYTTMQELQLQYRQLTPFPTNLVQYHHRHSSPIKEHHMICTYIMFIFTRYVTKNKPRDKPKPHKCHIRVCLKLENVVLLAHLSLENHLPLDLALPTNCPSY
jgi:hypothetical protein